LKEKLKFNAAFEEKCFFSDHDRSQSLSELASNGGLPGISDTSEVPDLSRNKDGESWRKEEQP
jgi:hypothetical protein